MQTTRRNSNSLEMKFEAELMRNRIAYTKPEKIIGNLKGNPSFVIPKYKIGIFCNEGSADQRSLDESDAEIISSSLNSIENKWTIFRFWENEIRADPAECCSRITACINEINSDREEYKFTFVDLYSGIGGFRIPLEKLGGRCLGYSEINKKSIETYKLNFSRYPRDDEEYLGDITKLGKLNLGEIDLIVGGVPCQSWSVAGKMKGFDDPRGKLWEDTIRVVKLNKPKAFIFENVKGLFDPRNKANLDLIVDSFKEIGYHVPTPQLLNSFDFGVPQNRDRIFIVGFRNDIQLEKAFTYPLPLNKKTSLQDILESVNSKHVTKKKIDINELHKGKIPLSRNRFQKLDEFNDFFIFCDTRNGHSTIHSWDIIETNEREKAICMTILKNRRKKKYGPKDGNPLSLTQLKEFIPDLKMSELETLVDKSILREKDGSFEFVNSKNSSGINGIYRVYLPNSDIFSTLTATGTNDMVALQSVDGDTVEEYKVNFIEEIYKKKKFRQINSLEAGKLQGFPEGFAVHQNESIAKKQFGNSVSIPVIFHLAKEILQTGVLNHEFHRENPTSNEVQKLVSGVRNW